MLELTEYLLQKNHAISHSNVIHCVILNIINSCWQQWRHSTKYYDIFIKNTFRADKFNEQYLYTSRVHCPYTKDHNSKKMDIMWG